MTEILEEAGVKVDLSIMDEDGDGRLSKDEAIVVLSKEYDTSGQIDDIFNGYDENGDGKISFEEYLGPVLGDDDIDSNAMGDDHFEAEDDHDDELEEEF
mmetsp:Transcript_48192/g.58344  ORF Transcript_48192/g.58344 Transcript_48192/m.58344 type:complete len:99 (+) Transcript_48192:288-584(+)